MAVPRHTRLWFEMFPGGRNPPGDAHFSHCHPERSAAEQKDLANAVGVTLIN
jgi:hypothetical protein